MIPAVLAACAVLSIIGLTVSVSGLFQRSVFDTLLALFFGLVLIATIVGMGYAARP